MFSWHDQFSTHVEIPTHLVDYLSSLLRLALGAQPSLRYLDEIGHLATQFDARASVRFGRTRAIAVRAGEVHFEGSDDTGKTWKAFLPISGGVTETTVWRSDFDRNSRSDLLIAARSFSNGRCIDEITLSFLLFNREGLPTPWVTQTRMPAGKRYPGVPAIFSYREGRTELIVTNCEYGDPVALGEDRSIVGIYYAQDTEWKIVRPTQLAPYIALVHRSHRFRSQDRLLTSQPASWPDQGNTFDESASPVTISAFLPASPECHGIRLADRAGRPSFHRRH